jgi:hypothetical protein
MPPAQLKDMVKTALRYFMVTAGKWQRRQSIAFGRRAPFVLGDTAVQAPNSVADEVRLFAMFFFGGLTFMSVYLA